MMDTPPSYNEDQERIAPDLPRYSASKEPLPAYGASLEYFGLSLMKTEFSSPYHYNSGNRTWKPVLLEINSTQLNIYDLKIDKKAQELIVALYNDANQLNDLMQIIQDEKTNDENTENLDELWDDAYDGEVDNLKLSTSSKWKSLWHKSKYDKVLNKSMLQYFDLIKDNKMLFEPTNSVKEYRVFCKSYRGSQIASYTLNNMILGEAPSLNHFLSSMYKDDKSHINKQTISTLVKYKNTLRIRVELKQLLLQFWSFYGMVHWFRNLTIGKDLSAPLEFRSITKLKSIPSRNSRNNNLLAATEAAAMHGMASEENTDVAFFNNPFDSNASKEAKPNCCCNNPASPSLQSQCSISQESIFSNERRESVVSTTTDISVPLARTCRYSKLVNKYSLISYDKVFATTVEKQYISNCIPDLNSFDAWCGLDVTLSNYSRYLSHEQLNSPCKDTFISSASLDGPSWSLTKMLKKHHSQTNSCRNFVIHKQGLVSIEDPAPTLTGYAT